MVPTAGVAFNEEEIRFILSSLDPPLLLESFEVTTLGYNNVVYFLETECGRDLVLKAGGRHWLRQKTESEVAGMLVARKICGVRVRVPRVLGFSSIKGVDVGALPWEWVLVERVRGSNLAAVWNTISEKVKVQLAAKIADIIVEMRTVVTPQSLWLDGMAHFGNLSLTAPELDATCTGANHKTFPLDDLTPLPGRIHISRILNGPAASHTYLQYVYAVLEKEIVDLERPEIGSTFGYELHALRLARLRSLLNSIHTHPGLLQISTSDEWRPIFTHGDLKPQNILVSQDDGADPVVIVLDWEWAGFFPPNIEWMAGIDELMDLFSDSPARTSFLDTLVSAGVTTPASARPDDWECATNISRLSELVVPWWLPADDGQAQTRKVIEEMRVKAVTELDSLLDYFKV